jgi:hypothetical protein
MPPAEKPRHRSGYSAEDTLQAHSACLTVAVTLGAYLDDVCIVGGLVPALLIDLQRGAPETAPDAGGHPGTNDLDVGLALAVLSDDRYAEISHRLRQEGFEPDTNDKGNAVLQRWRLGDLKVTVDFLMPPAPGQDADRRVQPLEPDFGALITPGLELAFEERVLVELAGHTLSGERVSRTIPVCGPAAFVVLKTLAFADRGEPKDAYDLLYVLRGTTGGAEAVAERLALHAHRHRELVDRTLVLLERDFANPDSVGPIRAAQFGLIDAGDLDNDAADAHGHVDDLLTAHRRRSLGASGH